ncbi:MAG: hypothetical protein ACE5DN_05110 [Flavobacteriales bacterium]
MMAIFALQGLAIIAIVVVLFYLVIRRLDEKKGEDFEKRNN